MLLAASFTACTPAHDASPPKAEVRAAAQESAAPPPTEEEIMKAWIDAGTPDERHKALQSFIGKWKTESKMWMGPQGEPTVSHGTATSRWILGGRLIQEEYSGTMMEKPFKGLSLLGFDKIKGKYYSTWNDTMSTSLMYSEGDYNPEKRELHMRGEYIDPVTKEKKPTELISRIESPNHHLFEMYEQGVTGERFKAMQIDYYRVK